MKYLAHPILFFGLCILLMPIFGFQKSYTVINMLTDIPIFVVFNLLVCIWFLEVENRKSRLQSLYLLILACVTLFASFLRMIPLPVGFSLSFLIPVSSGIVFGSTFGFLVGQFSMLMGGLMMGAIGPWLPYQSFMMGFIAYYAGFLFHGRSRNIFSVIVYMIFASLIYGYWLSTSYWPLAIENAEIPETLFGKFESYTKYYVVTSLIWDLTRAVGNIFIFRILFVEVCSLLERGNVRMTRLGS